MYDLTVIGSGIVGLASTYQMLNRNPKIKILILEKENEVAVHQSGRNSGVLHSGIYYQKNSLKAKLCFNGYQLMIEFCKAHNIPFEICGKIIVATSKDELSTLEKIYNRGLQNKIEGIKIIDSKELKTIEPYVNGLKAIHVPTAGIIDFKQVAIKLKDILQSKGVEFKFQEKVVALKQASNHVKVSTSKDDYKSAKVLNCAGLYSDELAKLSGQKLDCKIIPFRGEYYQLKPKAKYLVNNLIYPVPNPNFPFLGVHFTRRMDGTIDAGPNAVLAFKKEGYQFSDIQLKEFWQSISYGGFQKLAFKYWKQGAKEVYRSLSKQAFTKSLQQLIPQINIDDLETAPSGVRAQAVSKDGKLLDDFKIIKDNKVIHVINAPSPAATSSLAIGNYITNIVDY